MVEEKEVPAEWVSSIERLMQVVDTLRSPGWQANS